MAVKVELVSDELQVGKMRKKILPGWIPENCNNKIGEFQHWFNFVLEDFGKNKVSILKQYFAHSGP